MTTNEKRLDLTDEVLATIMTCALRFDGWRWKETMHPEANDFSPWITPIVETMTLHEDTNTNFATFFALQRFLGKWGGERLGYHYRYHTAYRFLFLHLYTISTPERWVFASWAPDWDRIPNDIRERHAGAVRETLLNSCLRKRTRTPYQPKEPAEQG